MSYFPTVGLSSNVPDKITTGTISALYEVVTAAIGGRKSCTITVLDAYSVPWSGTLVAEYSADGGTTWNTCLVRAAASATTYESLQATPSGEIGSNGVYSVCSIPGATNYRIRASVWNEGTAIISLTYTEAPAKSLPSGVVGDFYPNNIPNLPLDTVAPLRIDKAGNLMTRSSVLTDKGSFYEPFAGSTLSTDWSTLIGAGSTIVVANSNCTFSTGITAGIETAIYRETDYPPLTFTFKLSISQRIANQDIYFCYGDNATTPSADIMFARFHFDGVDNTKVNCETQSSDDTGGNEIETITLPLGLTTDQNLFYKITNNGKVVKFYIGIDEETCVLVDTHSTEIPDPYTVMYQRVRFENGTTPATSTDISVDTITCSNYNVLDIAGEITGDVRITQKVIGSFVNSTTDNLAIGASFVGKAESTLGVAGIQVNFKADQLCIIYCEQSIDGVTWDISDSYQVPTNTGDARTFQATNSYYRIRVINQGLATTTYLRLDVALCPIVEVVPRALSQGGGLLSTLQDKLNPAWRAKVTSDGDLRVTTMGSPVIQVRFSGDSFNSYDLYDSQSGGATRTSSNGICDLRTITAISKSGIWTKKRPMLSISKMSVFTCVIAFDYTTMVNNTRKWGLTTEDETSGIYFELLDGVLYATTMYDGTPSRVNIDYFKPTNGMMNRWQILMTGARAQFFLGDTLLAEINNSGLTDHPLYSVTELPLHFHNENTGVTTNPASLKIQTFAFYIGSTIGNQIIDAQEGNVAKVTKTGRLLVRPPASIKFTEQFYNNEFDITNVWNEVITGFATRLVSNDVLTLASTTDATDSVYETARIAMIPQSQLESQEIECTLCFGATSDNHNRREWGSKYLNNGAFFRIEGDAVKCVLLNNGMEVINDLGSLLLINDGKFHTFRVKRVGQLYIWFYIDEIEVSFFAANGSQPLIGMVEDYPYLANYNIGLATIPCLLHGLGIWCADEASSSTAIQGIDTYGALRNVKVDSRGRFITAPFEPIQTVINYTGKKVTQIIGTDIYGGILTTNYIYTGNKVTSITQVAS